MTKTNELHKEHHIEKHDKPKEHSSSDVETLKSSFAQLRDDVAKLRDHALSTGKLGVGTLKGRASSAVVSFEDRVGDLKDRGMASVEKFRQTISERPLRNAAIAAGLGFIVAKLTSRR